jgi:hypothetical protein
MEENDDIVVHACGASSSVVPRFNLIPLSSLLRLTKRYELGSVKHGDFNWKKGLRNRDYTIDRANHVIHHALKLIAKIQGFIPDDGDDDAAAIAWGGMFLCEAIDALKKDDGDIY